MRVAMQRRQNEYARIGEKCQHTLAWNTCAHAYTRATQFQHMYVVRYVFACIGEHLRQPLSVCTVWIYGKSEWYRYVVLFHLECVRRWLCVFVCQARKDESYTAECVLLLCM